MIFEYSDEKCIVSFLNDKTFVGRFLNYFLLKSVCDFQPNQFQRNQFNDIHLILKKLLDVVSHQKEGKTCFVLKNDDIFTLEGIS